MKGQACIFTVEGESFEGVVLGVVKFLGLTSYTVKSGSLVMTVYPKEITLL